MKSIDIEILKDLYLNKKLKKTEIARYFNVCVHTMYRALKDNHIGRDEEPPHIEDIKGRRFNYLTALEYAGNDKFGKALWVCLCDCGRQVVINAASIKRGLTKSCGHYKTDRLFTGHGDISGAYWHKIQRSTSNRNKKIDFLITIEEAWEIFQQQNGRCAISGIKITLVRNNDKSRQQTASPDRINSSLPYRKDNFQWVHKRINRLKNELTMSELFYWTRQIYEFNNLNSREIKDIDVSKLGWWVDEADI